MSDSDDTHERRRAERVPVNSAFANMPSTTYISDLSEGGVFVHTRRRAPIGAVVDLNFTVLLEDPFVLSGQGEVVRHSSKPSGMGIRFINPSPELVLRINDVITQQRPLDSGPPVEDPLDNENTVHRAPRVRAEEPDDELESLKTGIYPSIKIQVHDFDSAEFDEDSQTTVSSSTMQLEATEIEEIVDEEGPTLAGPSDPGPSDPGPSDPGPGDPGPSDPGPGDPGEQTVNLDGSEVEFIRKGSSDDD